MFLKIFRFNSLSTPFNSAGSSSSPGGSGSPVTSVNNTSTTKGIPSVSPTSSPAIVISPSETPSNSKQGSETHFTNTSEESTSTTSDVNHVGNGGDSGQSTVISGDQPSGSFSIVDPQPLVNYPTAEP